MKSMAAAAGAAAVAASSSSSSSSSEKKNEDLMRYGEQLVREFLLFRGFTSTLRSLDSDLSADYSRAFSSQKILDLFFSVYIPQFDFDKVLALVDFLRRTFVSAQDARHGVSLAKFEASLKKYYLVYAFQKGRMDRVLDFFQCYGSGLLQSREEDWDAWFALPYIKAPLSDPRLRVYFSKEWSDTFVVSFGNFLNEVLGGIRIPALAKVSSELRNGKVLKHKIEELSNDCDHLRATLRVKEQEISELRRLLKVCAQHLESNQDNGKSVPLLSSELEKVIGSFDGLTVNTNRVLKNLDDASLISNGSDTPRIGALYSSLVTNTVIATGKDDLEDEFPEVSIEYQETFSGHTSPITRCRFSAEGGNIASASADGTVRVWNSDPESSTSRNATIYCGAEVLSLEWDYKSDRLLLIGTAERGIKAWNVDAKRVVCDLITDIEYPRILDLKCSPVEPIFVSVASSVGYGGSGIEAKGYASLTLWNMKTWKPLSCLPLGEDPPTITSVCFNHNSKMLVAGATDGMIHLFDIHARLPITGWPAHDSSVSCVKFGPDQASIFSLGADGKVFEWSLHNQGQILQEKDASRFCKVDEADVPRHEIALDTRKKMLLLTSNSSFAPVYDLKTQGRNQRTLQHSAAITSVDWHPSQNKFITGSADHSVRVTSVLSSSI